MIILKALGDADTAELNQIIVQELEASGFDDAALEQGGDNGSFADLAHLLPRLTLLQQRTRCLLVFQELRLMAADAYDHYPTALHRYVLQGLLDDWNGEARMDLQDTTLEPRRRKRMAERADKLAFYAAEAIADRERLMNADVVANEALAAPQDRIREIVGDLSDVFPGDVRYQLEARAAGWPTDQ